MPLIRWSAVVGFGVPYLVGTLLLNHVSTVWAFTWTALYFAALFGWAARERQRRAQTHQATSSTDEEPTP